MQSINTSSERKGKHNYAIKNTKGIIQYIESTKKIVFLERH